MSKVTRKIYLLGTGGHSKVLASLLKRLGVNVEGIIDNSEPVGSIKFGLTVLGDDNFSMSLKSDDCLFVNGLGGVKSTALRRKIYIQYKQAGFSFLTLVDPSALVTCDVDIAEGAQILAGVIIQPGCHIGCNSIINTGSQVDHDCFIGEHCHIAPGVKMSGNIRIGALSHIGTGVNIIQSVELGQQTLVAAGTTVIKSCSDKKLIIGPKSQILNNPYLVSEIME